MIILLIELCFDITRVLHQSGWQSGLVYNPWLGRGRDS
jgi:hypothetical protein